MHLKKMLKRKRAWQGIMLLPEATEMLVLRRSLSKKLLVKVAPLVPKTRQPIAVGLVVCST